MWTIILEDGDLLGVFSNESDAYRVLKDELLTQYNYMDDEFRYQVSNAIDIQQLETICENYDVLISIYYVENDHRNMNLLRETKPNDDSERN